MPPPCTHFCTTTTISHAHRRLRATLPRSQPAHTLPRPACCVCFQMHDPNNLMRTSGYVSVQHPAERGMVAAFFTPHPELSSQQLRERLGEAVTQVYRGGEDRALASLRLSWGFFVASPGLCQKGEWGSGEGMQAGPLPGLSSRLALYVSSDSPAWPAIHCMACPLAPGCPCPCLLLQTARRLGRVRATPAQPFPTAPLTASTR